QYLLWTTATVAVSGGRASSTSFTGYLEFVPKKSTSFEGRTLFLLGCHDTW
ncbi:Hypothetical predicted protein, partial [Olea europaea subsp. europaea]